MTVATVDGISPGCAADLLNSKEEVALLDIREASAFGAGHPLFASHCPYALLESEAARLVPRADTAILLFDESGELALTAMRRLRRSGWRNVRIIDGGAEGWRSCGLPLFEGVNVPGKALGELLEKAFHPPTVDAATLARWKQQAAPFAFFDVRPPGEVAKMRIEGARCLPNGELAHRFGAVVNDPQMPVVLTCAGRTRGLVGLLGLRASGVSNPIYALENGTQGWALAGFALERGASPEGLPPIDDRERNESAQRARQIIARHSIAQAGPGPAIEMASDSTRTTYAFDLRAARERGEAESVAPAVLAGQLAQCADQFMAVRRARVVLFDTTGLRAALTALWLRALGFEPVIVCLEEEEAARWPEPSFNLPSAPDPIRSSEAEKAIAQGHAVGLDVRSSAEHEGGAPAHFAWHRRAAAFGARFETVREVILFGAEHAVAASAVDLQEAGVRTHWLQADEALPLVPQPAMSPSEAVDRIWFVHDRHDGNLESSRRYLAWEIGLIERMTPGEKAAFTLPAFL